MGVNIGSSGHRAMGPRGDHENYARSLPAEIELHIEELVLHGFAAGDRRRIGDAVQIELQRILGRESLTQLLHKESHTERLDAGTFKVAGGARPQTIGTQLARTVHRRLMSQGLPGSKKMQPAQAGKTP